MKGRAKGEHLIIYLAFFMNHLSHATKDNGTCDMYQNSGRTKGPVMCDWTNQSKWYSMAKLWLQTNFLMSPGPYFKPAVVVPLTKSENESNNSPEEDEAWGQQTVAILST
jgi:hypothetical protein